MKSLHQIQDNTASLKGFHRDVDPQGRAVKPLTVKRRAPLICQLIFLCIKKMQHAESDTGLRF